MTLTSRAWGFFAAISALCSALLVSSIVHPVAAAVVDDREVRVVALNRQANGAGLVAIVSYVCDFAYDYNQIRVRVAQSPLDRHVASASGTRSDLPCTGGRRMAQVGLHMSGHAIAEGSALVSAIYQACDGRDCYDKTYAQRVLAVGSVEVAAARQTTEGGTLEVAEDAQLAAGGAGVSLTLRARCAEPATVYIEANATQHRGDGTLIHGYTYLGIRCEAAWHSFRIVVGAQDHTFREGVAFVSLRGQLGGHAVMLHRTVTVSTGSVSRSDAHTRVHVDESKSGDEAARKAKSRRGTPAAQAASGTRVAVGAATLQAGGAGVLVKVHWTCEASDWGEYLSVELRQRLADGTVTSDVAGVRLSGCDGQWHTTRVGVVAQNGAPYARGVALVTARLIDASVATPITINAEEQGTGRSEGAFQFTLAGSGRLVDRGAGIAVEVAVRCNGPDFAVLRLAQRDRGRVITGDETALVECAGAEWKTLRVAAFANDVALVPRRTFVTLELAYNDDYQMVGASGYAYRTIVVL